MKKKLLTLAGAAALALGLGSCAYDPYYSGLSGTSVSVGYGHGHGYGSSAFTTSYFWGTGNSSWGYDPYVRCYYDYGRRAYYDPYLYGYYPVGFRPRPLIGVPHPHGYRQGWCPPPSRVSNVTVVNYRDRESAYRNTNHSWARRVKYDSRPQSIPAPRTRNRDEAVRNRGSNPFFGGFINNDGGQNREPRTARGSTFQPRDTTFRGQMPNARPTPSRPVFGSMPDLSGRAPDGNRGRSGRELAMPRIERAPRQIERPAPRQIERPAPRQMERPTPSPRSSDGRGESRRRMRTE